MTGTVVSGQSGLSSGWSFIGCSHCSDDYSAFVWCLFVALSTAVRSSLRDGHGRFEPSVTTILVRSVATKARRASLHLGIHLPAYAVVFVVVVDRFYTGIALFSALEQTHFSRMRFYLSD